MIVDTKPEDKQVARWFRLAANGMGVCIDLHYTNQSTGCYHIKFIGRLHTIGL